MKRYLVGIIIFSFLCAIMLATFFSVYFSDNTDNKANCIPIAVIAAVFLAFDVFNIIKYIKSTRAIKKSQQQFDHELNNLKETIQDVLVNSVEVTVQHTDELPHYPHENDEQPAVDMFVFDVKGNCSRSDGKPLTDADVAYLIRRGRDNVINNTQDRTDSRGLPAIPREVAFQAHSAVYKYSQVRNDLRILVESYELVASTVNCETFCMRFELMQEKARALLWAEDNHIRGIKQLKCRDFCITLLNSSQVIKRRFLIDYERTEYFSLENLKTNKGKINRLNKILSNLTKSADILAEMDEYDRLLLKTQDYIVSLGGKPAVC